MPGDLEFSGLLKYYELFVVENFHKIPEMLSVPSGLHLCNSVIPQLICLLHSPPSICQFGAVYLDMSLSWLLQKVHFVAFINMMDDGRKKDKRWYTTD